MRPVISPARTAPRTLRVLRAGRLARARSRAVLRPLLWLWVPLAGCAMGYAVITQGPVVVAALLAAGIFLLSLHSPQSFGFLAVALAPVSGLVMLRALGREYIRMNMSLWWLTALALIALYMLGRRRLTVSRATAALGVYSGFLVLSALWAEQPLVAVREGIQSFTFVMVFLVVDNTLRTQDGLERAVRLFLVATFALALGNLIGIYVVPVLPSLRLGSGVRLSWLEGYFHPVVIATIAGAASLVAGALLLGTQERGAKRLWLWAVVVVTLLMQALVLKRIEIVALVAGGFLLFLFYGWRRGLLYTSLAGMGALATLVLLPNVRAQFRELGDYEATKWHYVYPQAGWQLFTERPLLGHGAGAFEYKAGEVINELGFFRFDISEEKSRATHNIVMEIVAENGIVGLALFAWFMVVVVRRVWRGCGTIRGPGSIPQHLCRGFLGAICLAFIVSLAQNPHQWDAYWLILALGYRAASLQEEWPPAPRGNGGRRFGRLREPGRGLPQPVPLPEGRGPELPSPPRPQPRVRPAVGSRPLWASESLPTPHPGGGAR